MEKRFRQELETYKNYLKYPKAAAGRAIGYASAIYELSTHNQLIDHGSIEKRVAAKAGNDAAATATKTLLMSGRESGGMVDNRVGLMIFSVSGTTGKNVKLPWHLLYVVFRGSRGSERGDSNPEGAGWGVMNSQGDEGNIDWRANFTNSLTTPAWSSSVKVHKGFYSIYSSVGELVRATVRKALAQNPKTQVIVTGHSLGAGLSVLCGHDLECMGICKPFVFPFCCPRAGNLAFAQDFNRRIATQTAVLESEPDMGSYHRCFVFVQATDPVSIGGKKGFANEMTEQQHRSISDHGGKLGTVVQGLFHATRKKSKTNIFYHVSNLYKASWWGVHLYTYMEKVILGK
ncbi:MAG: lipase family protein [Gemmataceae bacterium]